MALKKLKNAFAVRCHSFGKKEERLYKYAESYFGKENTFLVINSDEKNLNIPAGFNQVVFNKDTILDHNELFWPRDVGWRCGDYCYYALWHALSGYEYIWLGEPDAKFCSEKAETFFSEFEKHNVDFVAPAFGRAGEKLDFYKTAKFLEAEPMSCLFPLTRLRYHSIGSLFALRKKISEKFKKEKLPESLYPNDEVFVSTVGSRSGLTCAPMDKLSTFNFMMFSSSKNVSFLEEDVENIKGRFLIHPVLDEQAYVDKNIKKFQYVFGSSFELLDHMTQAVKKCSSEKVKTQLKDRYKTQLLSFVDGIE